MLRCGCTSICLADRANKSNTTTSGQLEQSSCSWGQRAEQEEQRGDTFNWRVPWFPAFYGPANSCIQAVREWELPKCNIHTTTALLWVYICISQKALQGWVSDTQTSQWFECVGVLSQPSPSQVPQLRKPIANPKEVTQGEALHCHYSTRSTHTHQSSTGQ